MNELRIHQPEAIIKSVRGLISEQNAKAFNKRDCGLKLQTFLQVFTIKLCFMTNVTLEGLAIKCQELQYGLRLTKEGMRKRLGSGKKELQTLLGTVTAAAMSGVEERPRVARAIALFSSVLLTDATTISLPDKLAGFHKGHGGTNAQAAMKIQASYDIKSKVFRKIDQRDSSRENDAAYMDELIEELGANDLSITDLGYYGVAHFKKIAAKGAYFISKIKSNTTLYTQDGAQIDLVRELRGKESIDKMIVIKGDAGKTTAVVRLCGIKLPSPVYSERIRKANKNALSTGKALTKEERQRLKWVLMITNIPSDMLEAQVICELYRIRWQIELIFKSWKSHFSIDQMNNVGKDYWDCMLYGKLIVITLLTALHSLLNQLALRTENRPVSFLRFMKNMRESLDIVSEFVTFQKPLDQAVRAIIRIVRASFAEKRQRLTSEQAIDDFDLLCHSFNLASFIA